MRKSSVPITATESKKNYDGPVRAASPMEEALESLAFQLNNLEAITTSLIDTLEPITSQMDDEIGKEASDDGYSGDSAHVRAVHNLRYRVQNVIARLTYTNRKVEV